MPDRSGLVITGYTQVQFVSNQQSEDQLRQGGQAINLDQFMVRRGRLRVDRRWEWAAAAIEVDGSTTRGAFFGVRRAEGSLIYQGPSRPGDPPLGVLTAGLTEVPFGFELSESSRLRVFMERSTASLAYFPGEPDIGVRLQGGLRWFRYALGLFNGQPFDDRAGSTSGRDPTKSKDFVARLGVDTAVDEAGAFRLAGGLSVLRGEGFSPGKDATKDVLTFEDANENGVLDAGEVRASGGSAATPSQTFSRWAIGADFRTQVRWKGGVTRLFGEVTLASNLDRGLFFVDPVQKGSDFRHLGGNVALLHQLPWLGLFGVRFDYFDPNIDILDQRSGRFIPVDSSITTISPIVGLFVPDRGRLLVQYDFVRDSLGRNNKGALTDLRNDQLTIRLQVEL